MKTQLSDKEFFEAEITMGITPDNPDYLNLHYAIGKYIRNQFNPERTLEIGAGVGTLLEYLLKNNIHAQAIDLNFYEKEFFDKRNPDFSIFYKILPLKDVPSNFLDIPFDLLISIEVFEHITDEEILSVIEWLAKHCKYFFFSSTPEHTDWDLQWGHINVKDTEDWITFFSPWFSLKERLNFPTNWTLVFKSNIYEHE